MNDKTYINGDELTSLANSLKTKSENILSAYKGDCATAIQMSSECLQLSGLNTTEFFQALEKVYNQVNERINSFADFLNNVVVAEYNAVSEAIISSFNNDFANEMAGLLGISVTGFASATIKPIPGVPPSGTGSGTINPIPGNPNPPSGTGSGTTKPIPGNPNPPSETGSDTTKPISGNPNPPSGTGSDTTKPISGNPNPPSGTGSGTMKPIPGSPKPLPKDGEIKAVAFDDGSDTKPTSPAQTQDPAPTSPAQTQDPAPTAGTGVKPNLPPLPDKTSGGNGGSKPTAVYLDDNGNAVPATPTAGTGVKPNLPPLPDKTSSGNGSSSPTPIFLDDNGNAASATIKPSSGPSVKPNLPPLPKKPTGGTHSYSGGITSISGGGGGGGGGMAAAIALDSLANPLNRFRR